MRKNFFIILALLLGIGSAFAQDIFPVYHPSDSTPPTPVFASQGHTSIVSARNMSKTGEAYVKSIDYYDSFGRMEENTQTVYGLSCNDLVTCHEVDCQGRLVRKWLPVPVSQNSGAFVARNNCMAIAASTYSDEASYASVVYEASPLSRTTTETGPGVAWRSVEKCAITSMLTNNNSVDSLRCMRHSIVNIPYSAVYVYLSDYYEPGVLSVKSETDEDGHVTLTFTDRIGRLLLVRRVVNEAGESIYLDTYYVYDQLDRLSAVLPPAIPKQTGMVPTQLMEKYAYLYQYDRRGRLSAKKLPGAGWTYMAYDDADRVALSQDREMFARGESVFHSYDILGRECVTGIHHGNVTSGTADIGVSGMSLCRYTGTGNIMGYTLSGLSLNNPEVLTAQYYDSYSFIGNNINLVYAQNPQYDPRGSCSRGQLTGTVNARLSQTGIAGYDTTAVYHDYRERVIQERRTNIKGGHDVIMLSLGLNGEVIARRHDHTAVGWAPLSEITAYTYDGWGRPTQVTHSVNGSTQQTLATYEYDGLGRLESKEIGRSEQLDYAYNLRGWLTRISGDKFSERLAYNAASGSLTPVKPLWGGNVAAMTWETEEDVRTRGYQYVYDGQGRLTDAFYGEGSGLSVNAGRYDMHASYDAMGNPLWFSRKGKLDNGSYGYIDRVRMEYDGNHLVNATDSVSPGPTWQGVFHFADGAEAEAGVDEYEYDTNGSLTKDLNRNIFLIQYNSLNLPKKITFADNMGDISYTYSATGEKLSVGYLYGAGPIIGPILPSTASVGEGDTPQDISSGQTPRDGGGLINMDDLYSINYCGNVVYDHGVVRLLTDEGYVTFSTDGTPTYHFYVRDHLGNVRVVFDEDWDTEQVTHYYPFGGVMAESTGQSLQPWKYGGKELDRTHGLDAYDFGARTYFADRIQWGQMDPLCEKYYAISPYTYCDGNPVINIDPDGKSTKVKVLDNGTYQVIGGDINDKDCNIYVYTQDENGDFTIKGESIGVSATYTSFYDSDEQNPNKRWGGIINPKDNSGIVFLNDIMVNNTPNIIEYMYYARNGKKYDFKVTNGTDSAINGIDPQRGMPISTNSNGIVTYASARDIGNMAAGYMAASNSIPWKLARKMFDFYQGSHEGITTVNAQLYGYTKLGYKTPGYSALRQMRKILRLR